MVVAIDKESLNRIHENAARQETSIRASIQRLEAIENPSDRDVSRLHTLRLTLKPQMD